MCPWRAKSYNDTQVTSDNHKEICSYKGYTTKQEVATSSTVGTLTLYQLKEAKLCTKV